MNSKNSILLIDPGFDPDTAVNCNLLIKITADSFSYAIIDKNSNQVKVVYDKQECKNAGKELSAKLQSDSYFNLPFKNIKISVFTENSIAIPNDLFNRQDLNQYARYFTEEQSNNLYIQPFASYGFTSIFTLNKFIDGTLDLSLNNCKRFDQAAPVLAIAQAKQSDSLIIDFTAASFNAVYVNEGKLIFQKYFLFENPEEFNYYLLLMINQLEIDTSQTEVQLSGIIHPDDACYQCIKKYFITVNFNPVMDADTGNTILDDMPAHYYSSLLALDLCE